MRLFKHLLEKLNFITAPKNKFLFEIYHDHLDTEELVVEILHKIASEKKASIEKIKKMLLINQNQGINRRFWQVLDAKKPGHGYNYVGCCATCGSLELRKQL
jgi:hypothetical protein